MRNLSAAAATAVPLLLFAPAAQAHLVSVRFGDYYSGLLHPITALEHALAFVALALFAGMQGPRTARWMLLLFPLALLVGTGGAILAGFEGSLEVVNTTSFVMIGALVAFGAPLALEVAVILAVMFGLSHGVANGTAFLAGGNPWLYVAGVTTAGYVVVAILSAAVVAARHLTWAPIAARTVGSWVAAIGVMVLGLTAAQG